LSSNTAAALKDMMVDVVDHGTGTQAQIDGVQVAGKTGTAQNGTPTPHAWFIAFAPADNPQYAVAVVVPFGGHNSDETATGGTVAAPIAKQVLLALLGR
jgi:peptidoglycan glycosyltransferase